MSRVEPAPGVVEPVGTRVWRAVRTVLRSVWVVGLRDPVRAGRLRLDALSPVERQVARGGLVLLLLLLASTLFSAAWRAGQSSALGGANELNLVPLAVIGPTLLALAVGWVLVTWGALDATPSVRVVVAVLFLVTMSYLDEPRPVPAVETAATLHGPTVVRVGYLVTAGVVLLSVLFDRLGRAGPWLRSGSRAVLVASLAAFFLGRLWIDTSLGGDGISAFSVDLTVGTLTALALPIVVSSAVVVVDLALDVSSGVARPAARLGAAWAAALLLALVAVKLWFQVGARLGQWRELLAHQPLTVLRTVVTVALLAVLVAAVTRFPRSETFTDAKEKVIWLGSLALAVPAVLLSLGSALGYLVLNQLDSDAVLRGNAAVPWGEITRWWPLALSVLVLALGVRLMRRSDGGYGDELGSALVVVGAWNVPSSVVAAFSIPVSLSYPTIDVLVTIGVLAVLAAHAAAPAHRPGLDQRPPGRGGALLVAGAQPRRLHRHHGRPDRAVRRGGGRLRRPLRAGQRLVVRLGREQAAAGRRPADAVRRLPAALDRDRALDRGDPRGAARRPAGRRRLRRSGSPLAPRPAAAAR